MSTRILFVRAVNVGGAALPMAGFRELLGELGATNVRTYIASGNAICDIDLDVAAFDRAVEATIRDRYGYFREVMSRTPGEVTDALAAHPFPVIDPKYSYVAFLSEEPTDAAVTAAREVRAGDDHWQVVGREVHIRYANGAGQAELSQETLIRKLGVSATARNLRTVQALIDLAS